ncbi:MAG: pilus assembly protein TadG-related protein [Acidimicrobiia bacterium]
MASDRPAHRRLEGEHGIVVVVVAASLGALLVMVALVLDYSGARRDREANQLAADSVALAAAHSLGGYQRGADGACEAAVDYISANLALTPTELASFRAACDGTFGGACSNVTAARTLVIPVRQHRITLTHPVPNPVSSDPASFDPLLDGRAPSARDGLPCERFGVRVEQERPNLWASGSVELDVDAVGRYLPGVGDAYAPLVLLAEQACGALTLAGSSNLTVETAEGAPGYIAIDSDGSGCTNKNDVVLEVDGGGTVSAAEISMWAVTEGSEHVFSAKGLDPPVAATAPVGRNGIDFRYNCDPEVACPGSGPPYIDEMTSAEGWGGPGQPGTLAWMPGTFTVWTTCESASGNLVFPRGNWYIACGADGLDHNGRITFKGGNIVSDGPIVGRNGLRVNCPGNNALDTTDPDTCGSAGGDSILYLRSGDLTKQGMGQGSLSLLRTFVLLGNGSFDMSATPTISWSAPTSSDHPFEDLLFWTESSATIKISGSPTLQMEGTFFAPNAHLELTGSTGAAALGAQILTATAEINGGAQLVLRPSIDRINEVGKGRVVLIR